MSVQPDPTTMPTASQSLRLHAWNPAVIDEGTDAEGEVVRMLVATTLDASWQVQLGGINVAAAQMIAGALCAPFVREGGLMVPTAKRASSGLVLP